MLFNESVPNSCHGLQDIIYIRVVSDIQKAMIERDAEMIMENLYVIPKQKAHEEMSMEE